MAPSASPRRARPVLILALLAAGAWGAAVRAAQEPVTTRVDLLAQVRRLKTLGGRVHQEWLYLEDASDSRPDQRALVRGGGALEFGDGLLYHGLNGLDEALVSGRTAGPSYLTRVPHVWAVGPFHALSSSPAILVVSAADFNRLRDEGKAALEAEVDHASGIMDPYPRIEGGIPMGLVREIWVDRATLDRYEALFTGPVGGLPAPERALRDAVAPWRASGRLVAVPGLSHSEPPTGDFYPAAFEAVGAYFVGRDLDARIPPFRPR